MKRIDVAYALVQNPQGQILMVKNRHGTWSLPGGAREANESLADTALRECLEEASATVTLGKLIAISEVIKSDEIIMFFVFQAKLIELKSHSVDDEIEALSWLDPAQATQLMPWYPGGVETLVASQGAIYF